MSRRLAILAIASSALMMPTPASAQAGLPDSFPAGRDSNGEPCTATRSWNDPAARTLFDTTYGITCRGVAASRRQASIRVHLDPPEAAELAQCGTAVRRPASGLGHVGEVEARRCLDPATGGEMIRVSFASRGRFFVGEALPTTLGPMEATLRAVIDRAIPQTPADAPAPATIAIDDLPPLPAIEQQRALAAASLDTGGVLQAGIRLNHRGLFIEASRLLNDALSRLPATTPPLTRAEMLLEAGLADSNISQFDAATDHFLRASQLLSGAEDFDRLAFLNSKYATYRGLDDINRRAWSQAIETLASRDDSDAPLKDPAVLSNLNRPVAGAAASVTSTDAAQLSRLLVEAQRNWAQSVAYLATGDTMRARAALDDSVPYVTELQRNVSPEGVAALKSRLERQYGRVAARENDLAGAIGHFDCALAILRGGERPAGRTCLLDAGDPVADETFDLAAGGSLVADTLLERAALMTRLPGVSDAALLAEFDTAVDALARTGGGGVARPGMETYLDLLVRLNMTEPSPALAQRFFAAVQSVGEPAIARQVAQLQAIVTADGPIGARARDRSAAERDIIRLRYEISAVDPADTARRAALEAERQRAEAALLAANIALAADSRFQAVDDQPVTLAELRAELRPGEYYLKVTRLRSRAYALIIGQDDAFLHALPAPAATVDAIAQRVRTSIRDGSRTLPFFDVGASYALFKLIAGPAEAALVNASAIVVDPSGPLANLPVGVLVTRLDSVQRYAERRATDANDYSDVAFLGAQAELSSALSPRSFLITRRLAPSAARNPFIGFGENAPASLLAAVAQTRVPFGSGCDIAYGELAELMNGNRPVSADEIGIAAAALGVAGAPEITRAAFTDRALVEQGERGDFQSYQVLHFATHGLPETKVGDCTRVPPSLVTTLAPPQPDGGFPSDGLLSLPEVALLRLDANLVVLSACETASGVSGIGGRLAGQDESGATLDGLVRAFITANARAVLATYWQVPASTDTDRFIATFYGTGRTATIGAALQAAQRRLIADAATSHPYFWGAYFLVGDGSKTMLTPAAAPVTTAARR